MSPVIVIQQIRFQRSKWTRRQKGLTELYSAPEAVRVPLEGLNLSGEPVLHHILLLGTRDVSVPAERVLLTSLAEPLLIGGVTITRTQEQQVRMDFVWTYKCGAPNREWASQTFLVGRGEWAQMRYNGRHAPYHNDYWYYEKMVVNVGLCLKPCETLFMDQEPTYRFSLMSDLK